MPEESPVWSGPKARRLFQEGADRWIVFSRCTGAWQRTLRWITEYNEFSRKMCADSRVSFSWHHCLADNTLCYLFLVEVANLDRGSTRPIAARRALNRQRTTRDLPSLNDDIRISALIKGVRNARPRLRRQMESLDISDVKAVSDSWGRSAVWWKLMMALMINVGFLTVMRCGELVRLLRLGVILVLHSGRELNLKRTTSLPSARECAGMLVLLTWRKSKQAANAWLPVSCPRTVALMVAHESFLRSVGCSSPYCFPARQKTGKSTFALPRSDNHISTSSFVALMKKALHYVCNIGDDELRLYGGHSLRVGGSNFMRWLGVSDDLHKAMGGWAVLSSAREYMQRSPHEQFALTRTLAVKAKRELALERKSSAKNVLKSISNLCVEVTFG